MFFISILRHKVKMSNLPTCCSDPILGGSIFPCRTVVLLICSILSHLFVSLSVLLTRELPFYSICRKACTFIWIWLASRFSSAQIQWLIHVGYSLKPKKCMCVFTCVQLFATPWTVPHHAMEFSRQEHWSRTKGANLPLYCLLHWQADS